MAVGVPIPYINGGSRFREILKDVAERCRENGLKEHKIARSTADRLVAKHEHSLNPTPNCTTESSTEATEAEIQNLLDKIAPKLCRVLRTPASAYRFVDLLSASLTVSRKDTEVGFLVVKPSANTAVDQSVPEEAQVEPVESIAEPVPVIAEAQVEGGSGSFGASIAH